MKRRTPTPLKAAKMELAGARETAWRSIRSGRTTEETERLDAKVRWLISMAIAYGIEKERVGAKRRSARALALPDPEPKV